MNPQIAALAEQVAAQVAERVAELVADALQRDGWTKADAAGTVAADKVTTMADAEAAARREP